MARVHSADVPSFDAYPAPAPAEAASARPDVPTDRPYEPGPKTDEFRGAENQRLIQTAEQIGETLGRVVAMARAAGQRVDSVRREAAAGLTQQVDALSGASSERIDALRAAANERLEDASVRIDALRERASERLNDLRDMTERGLACGRERAARRVAQAREYARDNPEKVIGGALFAGLAIGIGIRMWNSSRRSAHV